VNIFAYILAVAIVLAGMCRILLWRNRAVNKSHDELPPTPTSTQKRTLPQSRLETGASLLPLLLLILLIRSFGWESFHIPSGSMTPTLLKGDFVLADKFTYGFKNPFNQRTLLQRGHPQRGDIAIFHYPANESELFIKRVIGLPGDHVVFDSESQTLSVLFFPAGLENHGTPVQISYSTPEPADHLGSFNYGQHLMERYETLGGITHKIQQDAARTVDTGQFFRQKGLPAGEWVVPDGQYFMMGDNRDNSYDSRYWGFVPERNLVGKAVGIWLSLVKQDWPWPTGLRLSRIGPLH